LAVKNIITYFELQSTFMSEQNHPLETLKDIKQMMERSSRFISLSGLSGVAAGVCALIGAWFAGGIILRTSQVVRFRENFREKPFITIADYMGSPLLRIAVATLAGAVVSALIFTYLRSRKHNMPIWGVASRRLLINLSIPLIAGGLYLLKLLEEGSYGLIAPGCLIFYGLALVNASKYTLSEIRYLGYCQLLIGFLNLYFTGYGLYFWALGFGVLHIIYGIAMWWRHERQPED
jgi:hypothetical protein